MADLIVAFSKIEDARNIASVLTRRGHNVITACRSGAHVLNATDRVQSGIIVSGFKLSDMMSEELSEDIPPSFRMIVVASEEKIEDNPNERVVYEPMPIKVGSLLETIRTVEETVYYQRRTKKPKPRDDVAKQIISDAKKLLMEDKDMSEPEAHRYIQKRSMESGDSLRVTAEKVIALYR